MILADYIEKCSGCGETIMPGDDIGLVDSEWVCSDCVAENEGEDDNG